MRASVPAPRRRAGAVPCRITENRNLRTGDDQVMQMYQWFLSVARRPNSLPGRLWEYEDWLEFMLRRGEELAWRLVVTPTLPLSAAARHYVSTNLYA